MMAALHRSMVRLEYTPAEVVAAGQVGKGCRFIR
jgi:hypothetical protein